MYAVTVDLTGFFPGGWHAFGNEHRWTDWRFRRRSDGVIIEESLEDLVNLYSYTTAVVFDDTIGWDAYQAEVIFRDELGFESETFIVVFVNAPPIIDECRPAPVTVWTDCSEPDEAPFVLRVEPSPATWGS